MPVVATLLSVAILLPAGLRPTQLLFHAAQERMTAQNPPAIHVVQFIVIPYEIVYNWDPFFTSTFWKSLFAIVGIRLLFSSAFYL